MKKEFAFVAEAVAYYNANGYETTTEAGYGNGEGDSGQYRVLTNKNGDAIIIRHVGIMKVIVEIVE